MYWFALIKINTNLGWWAFWLWLWSLTLVKCTLWTNLGSEQNGSIAIGRTQCHEKSSRRTVVIRKSRKVENQEDVWRRGQAWNLECISILI